jgi:hypothetical protein
MDKEKIKEALEGYFMNKVSDYAVMITGEWGIGKTYFLKKDVYPIIRQQKLRPIYVSLIGLNDDSLLEKLILQKINPFYNTPNKSFVAREADYIESIINDSENPDIIIPDNLVLCFDDLERIKPEFFESAMGFINVFIEHYKTKCVFLCNEGKLENIENFPSYKITKEKYIRFTYSFTPELREVLKVKVSDIKTLHKSYYDVSIIVEMFKRGKSYNLRTLFFTLSVFEQCLLEFDKLTDTFPHKNDIIKLVLAYCCFYTIETKKGTSYELLDKITIARKQKILFPIKEDFIINDELIEIKEDKDELKSNDDSTRLNSIQQSYFVDDSIDFERFISIAQLIKEGYLNSGMLEKEIQTLSKALEKKTLNKNESQIVQMFDDIFKFSDTELHQKIKLLVKEVKKGSLNLVSYLKLYQNLVWLESLRIKGVAVNDEVTISFREGVEKASRTGKLEYIQNLKFQVQWSINDTSEYAKKYSQFADFANSINEGLNDEKESGNFRDVLTAIAENNDNELINLLSAEKSLRLSKKNAKEIYDVLILAKATTINKFLTAMQGRYSNDGNFISQMPRIEKDFILTLFNLLLENKSLKLETEKSLKDVTLMFLKNYIEKIIEYHFPENKQTKNEE